MIDNERSSHRNCISSQHKQLLLTHIPSLSKHANRGASRLPRSAKSWVPNDNQAPAGVTDSFCGHQDAGTARHASDMAPI